MANSLLRPTVEAKVSPRPKLRSMTTLFGGLSSADEGHADAATRRVHACQTQPYARAFLLTLTSWLKWKQIRLKNLDGSFG
jgi:hypothetical protein